MKINPVHILLTALCLISVLANAQEKLSNGTQARVEKALPEFSVAGSLATKERDVRNINVGWRFLKSDAKGAEAKIFDDSKWQIVNIPNGLEVLPEEASGGINYRGVAWYRKHIEVPAELKEKRLVLYFEGIMGKSKIYVNGKLVHESFSGYLPMSIDVSKELKIGEKNIIAVRTDNSDDASYPPGKPQDSLDFCYFGGIYRDAYLIATNKVFITDANEPNGTRESGAFIWTKSIDLKKGEATIGAKINVKNESAKTEKLQLKISLFGKTANSAPIEIAAGKSANFETEFVVAANAKTLWSPDSPTLGEAVLELQTSATKRTTDSMRIPFGIRTFKISDKGFELNGKPFGSKLIGANRHQDFAELGNAVPNNLQWQDAAKLRTAGLRVIRCAHYPMDPAFMDACDRLGLFVIVATPGWQFWNNKAPFEERVYADIRQMVRRDRNHASVLMWEPILNESYYPGPFAKKAHDIVHYEYPTSYCYTACDQQSRGSEHYDVMYSHPITGNPMERKHAEKVRPGKAYFCREFGDNVDSWTAHNSPSRVSREWGEIPQLIQAKHYLKPDYAYTCWDSLFRAPGFHFGGALWHPFDHQRGYHPDPFFGGILDAFRQPKFSYFGFMSQRPMKADPANIGSGPMVKIAHAATPFSPNDITVYSNCDAVRLISQGNAPVTINVKKANATKPGLPCEPLIFKGAWDFQKSKAITRANREKATALDTIVAEGLVGGKVVCRDIVRPARRPSGIHLELDSSLPLVADGSSVAVVIATLVDEHGDVKRLNNEEISFEIVNGHAHIAGANERKIEWGTAAFLVRLGTIPGEIKLRASVKHPGTQKPRAGELTITTTPNPQKMLFLEKSMGTAQTTKAQGNKLPQMSEAERRAALEKVGADQAAFE